MRMSNKGERATNISDYRINNARVSNSKRFPNGCIYIINIEDTDYYKIGVSQNPNRRIRDLESSTPFNIYLIYCKFYEKVYEIEQYIHNKINSNYIKSEWFKLEFETVYDIMKELKIMNVNSIKKNTPQIKMF